MEAEVAVLDSLSLIVLMVTVDVKQHEKNFRCMKAQELCEQGGGAELS